MSLFSAPLRSAHESPNYGAPLILVGTSCPATATSDEVIRGAAEADTVMLSADGRHWLDAWHRDVDGREHEAVYVEKHTRGGAVFHGFVDSKSRRVVQTG